MLYFSFCDFYTIPRIDNHCMMSCLLHSCFEKVDEISTMIMPRYNELNIASKTYKFSFDFNTKQKTP